jgi:GNAT superfamily N-acetyltransferase
VFPDPHQYLTYFPKIVPLMGGGAFDAGSAYCTDDFAAASLWLPPGVHSDAEGLAQLAATAIAASDQEKVFSFLGQMGTYHPTEPHWYLPFIAVDPMHQGKGLGSALLIHALQACDHEQLPAYLEATSPDSRRLYERHGFEALGEIQAADSPPLFPMLRKPR